MTRQPRRVARRRRRSATKLRRSPVRARLSFEQIELHRGLDFESRDRSGHMLADQGDDDDARSTLVAAMTRVTPHPMNCEMALDGMRVPAGRETSRAWVR